MISSLLHNLRLWSIAQPVHNLKFKHEGGSSGIGYGLKYQVRCIPDVKADTDHTSFIIGNLSLKEENEVHLIRLSSSGTELLCEGLFFGKRLGKWVGRSTALSYHFP